MLYNRVQIKGVHYRVIVKEVDINNIISIKNEIKLIGQQIIISINQEEYDMSNFDFKKESFEKLVNFFRKNKLVDKYLSVDDFDSNESIVVLLALTYLENKFYYNDDLYELSFAYAVPLNRDVYLMEFTIDNLEDCLETNNIVFLECDTLYLCEKVSRIGYERVCKKNKKTIHNNEQIIIEQIPFSTDFFEFWEQYNFIRFGEKQQKKFMEFFLKLYNSSAAFKLYRYCLNGEVFAYNVLYYSQDQEVIYDVLFPWIKNESVYRIGIYSIIKNLQRAVEREWGYSICYGQFEYKDQLWKYLN